MSRIWVSAAGVLLAVACSAPADPVEFSLESREAPVVAGTLDKGDPSIVELFAIKTNSVAKCTATLITPRILLTAAHCIYESRGARYGVFLGSDDARVTGKDLLAVTTAVYDPMYNDDPSLGHDIAVVVLTTPLTMPVVPMNRAALTAAAVGKDARVVGYGLTNGVNHTGDGIKREATAPLAQITRNLIRIGPNAHGSCNGDSGGPLLMDNGAGEAIIGVVSFGNDATCRRDSYYQRLDTQIAFIDEQIRKYDPGVSIPDAGAGLPVGTDAGAGTDAKVTVDAGATRDAGAPDVLETDPLPYPPGGFKPPTLKDAGVDKAPPPKPREPKPTTGPDAASDDDENGEYTQSLKSGGCALGGRGGATGWGAGLLIAAVVLLRRRRR